MSLPFDISEKLKSVQVRLYVEWLGRDSHCGYGFAFGYDEKSYRLIDELFQMLQDVETDDEDGAKELWLCARRGTIDDFAKQYGTYEENLEDGTVKNQKEYGYIMRLGSHVFFHGLAVGETNKVNIADGKTLVIKYLGLGEVDKEGMRTVSFELNGIRRDVQVPDEEAQKNIVKVPMADPEDKSQVGSSIPGAVSRLNVKVGDTVEKNQTLVTIEAMKMETAITARMSGTVSEILVKEGETVKGGQLILVIK